MWTKRRGRLGAGSTIKVESPVSNLGVVGPHPLAHGRLTGHGTVAAGEGGGGRRPRADAARGRVWRGRPAPGQREGVRRLVGRRLPAPRPRARRRLPAVGLRVEPGDGRDHRRRRGRRLGAALPRRHRRAGRRDPGPGVGRRDRRPDRDLVPAQPGRATSSRSSWRHPASWCSAADPSPTTTRTTPPPGAEQARLSRACGPHNYSVGSCRRR